MNKKQKNLTNKGFSLVELIIVIAIMAVLVGVLAPQYIKYVEKSRVSADAQQVEEFTGAMTVLASDVDVTA
ncbi:MAG: type IV pilin protein [Waltera sp.]